ncbi:MAG: hypothetical protein A4E58_00135 [Syntrophorhabdus sp. PtaB.Bin006]|nr:MAG: hypothetical protein A4E58_00135 [Syntrophorhabdus sp. PtaB.Bin006]
MIEYHLGLATASYHAHISGGLSEHLFKNESVMFMTPGNDDNELATGKGEMIEDGIEVLHNSLPGGRETVGIGIVTPIINDGHVKIDHARNPANVLRHMSCTEDIDTGANKNGHDNKALRGEETFASRRNPGFYLLIHRVPHHGSFVREKALQEPCISRVSGDNEAFGVPFDRIAHGIVHLFVPCLHRLNEDADVSPTYHVLFCGAFSVHSEVKHSVVSCFHDFCGLQARLCLNGPSAYGPKDFSLGGNKHSCPFISWSRSDFLHDRDKSAFFSPG